MQPTPLGSLAKPTDEARAMTVRVNDKPQVIAHTTTLSQLLDQLGLASRNGVAIAVNDAVAPRSGWPTRRLADGDQVLVIQATQGG